MTTTSPAPAARAATGDSAVKTAVRRRGPLAPWGFLAPFLAVFTLCFVLPILYAVYQSFTRVQRNGLFGELGHETVFAGFANYTRALDSSAFVDSIGRMLLFGIVQVPIMLGLALLLALLLETASAAWPAVFRAMYFMPYGVPGAVGSLLWGFLYVPGVSPLIDAGAMVGLEVDFLGPNTVLWSIANIVTWQFAGYNMLIIIAQLKSIPGELYEAARIDGASTVQIARSIQLPLIRPALILTTVFSIIGTLQLFVEPLVMQAFTPNIDSGYTPNLSAYNSAFTDNDYNVAAAQSVIIALAAFVLSFSFLYLVNRRGRSS